MAFDERIIQACIEGDRTAQAKLYKRFASQMLGVCLRYTNSHDEAEDILQEGFIKVFYNLENFRNEGSFEGWIKRIMINTALNHYHQNKRNMESLDFDEIREIDIRDDDEPEEIPYSENEMLEAFQKLPEGYKMVFNLYVFEDMMHKEIAETLNISVNTSKSQLSKARAYLQKSLRRMKLKKAERE